jgi:predicted house-cleaning noncanonical NTP pyrophosphatase (MazG superfamily)
MAEGTPIRVSRAKYDDMPDLLLKKLREETVTLADALVEDDSERVVAKLADCYEVLLAIAELHDTPEDELAEAAATQRKDHGAFAERYVVHGSLKPRSLPAVTEAEREIGKPVAVGTEG